MPENAAMLPIDYLRQIEHAKFPLEEADSGKVRCVELLRAVGYLDATITPIGSEDRRAQVARITWMGQTALTNRRPGGS